MLIAGSDIGDFPFLDKPSQLLQCLVLSGKDLVNKLKMAKLLIEAGAGVNG